MRINVVCVSIVVSMLASSVAVGDMKEAQKAFTQATSLYESGKFQEAAMAFHRSYEAEPNWKIFYNIGLCEASAKEYESAMEAFGKYLAEGGAAIEAGRRKEVEEELVLLKSRQLFRQGTELFAQAKFTEAVAAFRKAYETRPHWKLLYNIGQSEAAAGHFGLAVEAFEKYLALGGDSIDEIRVQEVETELERLQRRVGFIAVTATEGAQIFVDGQQRGTAPLPGRLLVVAGVTHELKVVHNGNELARRTVKVSGRQSISITVGEKKDDGGRRGVVVAQKNIPADTVRSSDKTRASQNAGSATAAKWQKKMLPVGIGLMATSGASLVSSLIIGVVIKKRRDDLDCPEDVCPPDYHEKNDSVNHLIRTGNVLFVAGAGLAAVGAVLFVVGKKRSGREQPVAVTPGVGPQMAGVVLTGRF